MTRSDVHEDEEPRAMSGPRPLCVGCEERRRAFVCPPFGKERTGREEPMTRVRRAGVSFGCVVR